MLGLCTKCLVCVLNAWFVYIILGLCTECLVFVMNAWFVYRMLYYPECSHPISEVCSEADAFVNIVRWFHDHLNSTPVTKMEI